MKRRRNHRVIPSFSRSIRAAGVVVSLIAGCGSSPDSNLIVNRPAVSDCIGQTSADGSVDQVVLVWNGGESDLLPGQQLDVFEFGVFVTPDGGTLADAPETFKETVRSRVASILCGMPGVAVHVENEKGLRPSGATVIHIAQIASEPGSGRIGQADYDPCDEYSDDAGIIFGEELLRLGGPYPFDDWALMVANVTAHETAHTLGFPHVPRVFSDGADRPLYVELMLAVHTVDEMTLPQRYLAKDSNCPDEDAPATTASRTMDALQTCGVVDQLPR
ncbi:MAG: hypothetical protein AABZ12_14135 [Planctomycetota bacterium]